MCGATQKSQAVNEYLSNPANGQFQGGPNDNSMMLSNIAGGREQLSASNQEQYDKQPWAPKRSASPGLGSGGDSSARGQPAAKTVSSTILGGTA